MTDDQEKEDMGRVQKSCEELGEHFDTVQIFATRYDPQDGTTTVVYGTGDYFARAGLIRQWLIKENRRIELSVEPENPE